MQDQTEGTTTTQVADANVQSPAASSPTTIANIAATLGSEAKALEQLATGAEKTLDISVGDRIATVDQAGDAISAVVLERALIARFVELAQQVHHFVANEGSPIVNELKIVAAEVGQYL